MSAVALSFDEQAVALSFILKVTGSATGVGPESTKPASEKAAQKKAEPVKAKGNDDDVDDLFGDDDKEEEKPKVSRAEQMKAAAEAKKAKKKIEKSQVVIEVKPWEADQDLKAVYEKIKGIQIDGAIWGEAYNLVPVAFGIKKLVISVVIEDEKVGLDDLTDALEALEDDVQSVDVTTMNRL
eukprot:198795_1